MTYTRSQLTYEKIETFRRDHGFTKWMSPDLLQAATDFCKNIGLIPLYAERGPKDQTRYLFWHPPEGARCEVRSGRDRHQFVAFDKTNVERGWPLLSLHVSEQEIYSAVWICPEHYEAGVQMLATYGISPASKGEAR
jgi:hypothetical protein